MSRVRKWIGVACWLAAVALGLPAHASEDAHVLVLGRVTSGAGGDIMLEGAREVLSVEFPDLAERITFHVPDEKDKRHGQAIAAASLPTLRQ